MEAKESPAIVVTHDDEPASPCDPMSFHYQMSSDPKFSWLPNSTRLLSVDEVISLVSNASKKETRSESFDSSCRMNRVGSADCDASSLSPAVPDEYSDVTSDGTLSRCTSTDRISLADGQVEDRFRVDRRKLEAMILGCPPDPCDFEIMRLPIGSDGRILSADDFFAKIMDSTSTEIRYPRLLKVGARNRKDPHIRVVGTPENVSLASHMVRAQMEPHNKITMKMDVSWTHHSHIIGKAGNTIQPVVRRTGVSIHFPDGNKNNEIRKSNQVSINSRGEELCGLEEARTSIRQLTPLIFTFALSANAKYISISDPNLLVQHVQGLFNVQVELSVTSGTAPLLIGSVRGSETDVSRVKEATLTLLQNLCGPIASHLQVQMKIEVSPQHHSFILGRNNECLKRIMQTTSTKISFPDNSDPALAPLQKSTVTISGAIDNVYAARQNIVGALPLVLMFEIGNNGVSVEDIAQVMQSFNLNIIPKPARADGRRPVIIKGAERDAAHIYEAWKLVTQSDKKLPTVMTPPSYHISQGSVAASTSLSIGALSLPWTGHHPRTSSTSMSPHPLSQNLPSPLTPAFAPPTPTFPPPGTPCFPQSPLWPASSPANPITPTAATSFPFPAHPGLLYDGSGGNSFFSSTTLAALAASSPAYNTNTAGGNHFFGANTNINSNTLPNLLGSNVFGGNNSYLAAAGSSANKNIAAAAGGTNFMGQNILGNSNSLFPLPNPVANIPVVNNHQDQQQQFQQQFRQQQQQQQQQDDRDHLRQQHMEALKALCRRGSPDAINSSGASSSSGVSSPNITSPNDSSPRDSSPDMVVLGHIQSPPVMPRRRLLQQLGGSGPNDGVLEERGASPELGAVCGELAALDVSNSGRRTAPVDGQADDVEQARIRDLSKLLNQVDWRAPGVEKGLQQAIQKLTHSDYEAQQILANKAMREPVGGTVRTPTSSWSGFGFSKSSPSQQMRQQFQQAGLLKKTVDRATAPHWGDEALSIIDISSNNTTSGWASQTLVEDVGDATLRRTGDDGVKSSDTLKLLKAAGEIGVTASSEDDWPSETKWSSNDGTSPTTSACRSGASALDSGLAASITSSNQASLSLSDPESSDGLGASGSSGCSYSSSSSAGAGVVPTHRGAGPANAALPRLSASNFSDCVPSSRRMLGGPSLAASASHLDLPRLLEHLQLSQYIDVFSAQEVDLPMFLSLTDCELKELGISAFGHRKRLLVAIKNLTSSLPEYGSIGNGGKVHTMSREETAVGGGKLAPQADKTVTWNC